MTDLILTNADIITMDPLYPKASALSVETGRISSVGGKGLVLAQRKPHTRIMDLEGKTLCPGFIDPHLHFRAMAESFIDIDISPDAGFAEVEDIVECICQAARNTPEGKWIRAAGYNDVYLKEKRHPDRWDLDAVSPNHPVKLTHRSTYAHVLNTQALRQVGIDRYTADPDGGIIERDLESGEPTGLLFGMGAYLSRRIPGLDDEALLKGAQRANEQLLSFGITSFQDASSRNDESRYQWLLDLKKRGVLVPKTGMMMGVEWFDRLRKNNGVTGLDQQPVRVRGVKIIVDETTGKLFPPQEELNQTICAIHRCRGQAVVHAIEDTAIESALSAFEYALSRHPWAGHRHRIEHCSVCPPELCRKMAALGIFAVTHPAFVYYHGDRYRETVSEKQAEFLYPISSLIQWGVSVAAASDGPIVKPDPISGIHGAVTRLSRSGKPVPGGEGVSPYEALNMYTHMAAKAGLEENIKGRLSNGSAADLVVLSANPLTTRARDLRNVEVLMTMIDGGIVWRK